VSQASSTESAIADYGFLSDCSSAALVDRTGSIDWWCVPRFDSPSVFGRLLGPEAGHWSLRPGTPFTSERSYVGNSMVIRTVFTTDTGEVAVTDALVLERGARGHQIGLASPHVLIRRVEGLSGAVPMLSELAPRMEYGRTEPHLTEAAARAGRAGVLQLAADQSQDAALAASGRTQPQLASDAYPEPLTGEVLAAGKVKPRTPDRTAPAAVRSTGLATAARAAHTSSGGRGR